MDFFFAEDLAMGTFSSVASFEVFRNGDITMGGRAIRRRLNDGEDKMMLRRESQFFPTVCVSPLMRFLIAEVFQPTLKTEFLFSKLIPVTGWGVT